MGISDAVMQKAESLRADESKVVDGSQAPDAVPGEVGSKVSYAD